MSEEREEQELGLRRVVIATAVGPVVARIGAPDRGHVVLLVHGAAGSWRAWLPMLRAAARLGRPIRAAVAVDLPGWGESADPLRPLDAASAAAALAQVARAAGADSWVVVGHSLGGIAALELAHREPVATTGVVLVSPTGPAVLDAVRRPVRGGMRLPWFAGMLLAMRALAALPGGGRPLLGFLSRLGLLGALASPLFTDRRAAGEQVLLDLGAETRPAAFLRAARSTLTVATEPWTATTVPVRSIRGARDVFVGPADAAAFRAGIPDFAETVVPGAGHFALAERPETVLAAVEALGRARSGPCGRIGPGR